MHAGGGRQERDAPKVWLHIGYKILGGDIQFVEVELEPGRAVVAEPGAMLYLEAGVTMETVAGGILSAGARLLSGESFFLTTFTNGSGQKRQVAFAASFPGKIFAIRLCGPSARCSNARGRSVGLDPPNHPRNLL